MANELVNMSEQFKGLDMSSLIGGPLIAICEANKNLAMAASDYIDRVGMNTNADGSNYMLYLYEKSGRARTPQEGSKVSSTPLHVYSVVHSR